MSSWRKRSASDAPLASLVADNETLFLGSGTTVVEVARNLREHKNLTVITNSLPVLNILAGFKGSRSFH